jgi:hypothetical protein
MISRAMPRPEMPRKEDGPWRYILMSPVILVMQAFYVLCDALRARLRRSGGKGEG